MNIRACRPTDPEAGSVNVVSVQLWHHDRANAVALLEASRTLLSAGLLAYSYAGTPDEVSRQRTQGTLHERLPGVFWTNVYGKRYVETIGLERLRSIAWSSIEVSDAGVVAQLYEDPAQPPADLHAMVDEAKSAVGREFFGARWLGGDLASFLEPKHAEHHQALPRLARS
ncbi:MAG: hypothetical protein JO246_12900 [Frankiaceae bacterium]|nr:hypothetical protein [Frankiaceae bacterium]